MVREYKYEFKNKRILVTGGTGSIGSAIVKELIKYEPRQIRVFSRDDSKQFELAQELGFRRGVNFLIGDIRDKERLSLAMENVEIVFHAAALKHVPSCERNPFEAIKTNVLGTQNIINCAFENGVDKVVTISTDKATDPTNVMGCTKLLAEKAILATYFYKGYKKTKFCCVRFGNVIGSRGSVVPLFINQAKNGGPVTITNPNMTRFMMLIRDAVNLVFKACLTMQDREIFILKMPSVAIGDLADAVIEVTKRKNNLKNKKVSIKTIGARDGERVHEKLMTKDESQTALEMDDMFIILPNVKLVSSDDELKTYPGAVGANAEEYASSTQKRLSKEEVVGMLERSTDLAW